MRVTGLVQTGKAGSNAFEPEVRKPCLLQRKRPQQLRERASGVRELGRPSSLDALDLPMEIEGVFYFDHKKAQSVSVKESQKL